MADSDVTFFERNSTVPDSEVESDIADTEREIVGIETELRLLRFRVQGKEGDLLERRTFVARLRAMLEHRRANP